MSAGSKDGEIIKGALEGFANILGEHSKKTDEALTKLTDAVQKLTESHIEHKKDRENDVSRMERIEANQKEQGNEIKHISDTVLLLDERVGNQKDKWGTMSKVLAGITTTVIAAAVVGAYIAK